MVCVLCEKNEVEEWFGKWCFKCRRHKHLINLYGVDKVSEVLERVLVRQQAQQEHKIKDCVVRDLDLKGYDLRSKPK